MPGRGGGRNRLSQSFPALQLKYLHTCQEVPSRSIVARFSWVKPVVFQLNLMTAPQKETYLCYCKPGQNLVAGVVIDRNREENSMVLLDGRDAAVILPYKLCAYVHRSLLFSVKL